MRGGWHVEASDCYYSPVTLVVVLYFGTHFPKALFSPWNVNFMDSFKSELTPENLAAYFLPDSEPLRHSACLLLRVVVS